MVSTQYGSAPWGVIVALFHEVFCIRLVTMHHVASVLPSKSSWDDKSEFRSGDRRDDSLSAGSAAQWSRKVPWPDFYSSFTILWVVLCFTDIVHSNEVDRSMDIIKIPNFLLEIVRDCDEIKSRYIWPNLAQIGRFRDDLYMIPNTHAKFEARRPNLRGFSSARR